MKLSTRFLRPFAIWILSPALLALPGSSLAQSDGTKSTLYYIPHTHWEGAVFKTREDYLEMGLPNILTALRRASYSGWLWIEWEKKWHPELAEPEVALPQHAEALRTYLAALV